MTTRYVEVKFVKQEITHVIAQVNTDLSGVDLENKVTINQEWMEKHFGDEWEEWDIENVTEITDEWSILKNRSIHPEYDRHLNEAPLFEIAKDDEQQ